MIEEYAFGRISVDGRTYRADVIVFPERVADSWRRREGHNLCLEDLAEVLSYRPEVLVIGQGHSGLMQVPAAVTTELARQGIGAFAAPTAEAVREYNRLAAAKKVVAALHLTC